MRVFLDACIIIYWVEAADPFYTILLDQLKHIAEQYPKHHITLSRLSILECLVKPLRDQNQSVLSTYRQFFEDNRISIIELDSVVIDLATQLRAQYYLRTPDAIQAACCLATEERHVYVTNDKQFSRVKELNTFVIA